MVFRLRAARVLRLILSIMMIVAATLVLSEIVLRIAASAVRTVTPLSKAFDNRKKRILAIGESTTEIGGSHSYPSELQNELERRSPGRYEVWNGGQAGASTDVLLDRMPEQLSRLKPDIVILMMGINDRWTGDKIFVKPKALTVIENAVGKIRVVLALQLIWIYFKQLINPEKLSANKDVFLRYRKVLKEEKPLRNLTPQEIQTWNQLQNSKEPIEVQAERYRVFEMSVAPAPMWLYMEWADWLSVVGKPLEAHAVLVRSLRYYHKTENYIYVSVKWCVQNDAIAQASRIITVKPFLELALKQSPNDPVALWLLALYEIHFHTQPHLDMAKKYCNRVIYENQPNVQYYLMLADIEIFQNRISSAEHILREGLQNISDGRGYILAKLSQVLIQEGRPEEAADLQSQVPQYFGGDFSQNQVTVKNYRRAIQLIHENGAEPWVLAYPESSIDSLQIALGPTAHFVNLQNRFARQIEERGYDSIFNDRFAGNFGHFTIEGSQRWAALLADEVIRSYELQELAH